MKIFLFLFSIFVLLPAIGGCADDCAGSDDACRPSRQSLTPFMAELEKAAAEKKPDTVKDTTTDSERTPGPETSAAEPAAAPASAPDKMATPPGQEEVVSKPGWMVAAILFLYGLYYFLKMNHRFVDDLVVNMVDVGEETGELDAMLYKVADTYDEEVRTMTDGLMSLLEPLLICFLGFAVGFIVVSLFMPLVDLISKLSCGSCRLK